MNKELIDRNHFVKSINESIAEAQKWGASAQNDEIKIRAEQAIATFCEASLRAKQMPTIDAVEVVRCKDCKYYKPMQELDDDGNVTFTYDNGACTRGIEWHREWEAVTGEDYCSKGERRETECKP